MRKQLCPYQRNSAIGSQSFQCPAKGMREFRHRAAAMKTDNAPAPDSGDAAGRFKLNGEAICARAIRRSGAFSHGRSVYH
jgi:hypothetical protein